MEGIIIVPGWYCSNRLNLNRPRDALGNRTEQSPSVVRIQELRGGQCIRKQLMPFCLLHSRPVLLKPIEIKQALSCTTKLDKKIAISGLNPRSQRGSMYSQTTNATLFASFQVGIAQTDWTKTCPETPYETGQNNRHWSELPLGFQIRVGKQ